MSAREQTGFSCRPSSHRLPANCSGAGAILLGLMMLVTPAANLSHAAEDAAEPTNLAGILSRQTRIAFDEVSKYVQTNPDAGDVHQSYDWLFQTARQNGYEAAALPLADSYLKRSNTQEATARRARQTQILGLAASGKMKEAMEGFAGEMRGVRLRSPNATVDFALALASTCQVAGDYAAAQQVVEKLSTAFFLNPYVRGLCDNRLYRLELADKPAPKLGAEDFDGKPVELSSYEGKVLLVDFWATNCAPCLEEFPAIKQLYADYHGKGLEIVGISLDEDRETVDQFQESAKLPWRMTMSSADGGATRARYRARTIPSMFLIDQKGRIVRVDVRGHNLRRSVEQLLKTAD